MKVLRYNEHALSDSMVEYFFNVLSNPTIMESESKKGNALHVAKKLAKDLNFNYGLVFSFGAGINALAPIVSSIISNSNLKIDLTLETVVLITIATLAIVYIKEKNDKSMRKDIKNMLEELKLRGVGNGVVRKLSDCVESMSSIIKLVFKHNTRFVINSIFDMFGFASILFPTMNAISALIGKYDLNADTLPGNLLSMGVGISTFLIKNGLDFLINKFRGSGNSKIHDGESDGVGDENQLIKEQ